mgnify:CR=1 FL=1
MKQFRDTTYYITKEGKVWNGKKFLKGYIMSNGYLVFDLYKDKLRLKALSHRLVMEVYRGASNKQVHHIDNNKTNNSLNNLEYVSQVQNMNKTDRNKNNLPEYITKQPNRNKWVSYTYRRTVNGKRVTLKTSSNLDVIKEFKIKYENL